MTHERFSMTDDWELEDPSRDVRGRTVLDAGGSAIGTVTDMLVDPQTESIDAVVLDNGQELAIDSLAIDADTVRLTDSGPFTGAADLGGYGDRSRDDRSSATSELTDDRFDASATSRGTTQTDGTRVRLREEDLQARTRREQAGEVIVDKSVVTEERSIDVPVTHEEVVIQRRPVTDGSIDGNEVIDDGDTIRIPVTAETVEVTKQPRVVEEIEISKRAVTENQRVSDTVRRETVDVRDEGDVDVVDASGREGLRDR